MKFTVDRTKWYRGHGEKFSRLLVTEDTKCHEDVTLLLPYEDIGKMCCLGFRCIAAGATPEQIGNEGLPMNVCVHVSSDDEDDYEYPFTLPGSFEEDIAAINDDARITEEAREVRLKEQFAKIGDEIEFIN